MSEEMPQFAAEERIGLKVIEMADRCRVAHKVIPGAEAKWKFEMDGVWYEITVGVTTSPVRR